MKKVVYLLKKFFLLIIIWAGLFSFPQKSLAWDAMPAAIAKQAMEEVSKNIQGVIMGSLKKAALTSLNNKLNELLGGNGSSTARFITNWTDYLISKPAQEAQSYMNDYISQAFAGRDSYSGYEGVGSSSDYLQKLSQSIKDSISSQMNPDASSVPVYEGDPSTMFSGSDFSEFSKFIEKNPWVTKLAIDAVSDRKLSEEKLIAQAQAIAYQGYKGTTSSDNKTVSYPGSAIASSVASIQNMGPNTIANASSPSEVLISTLLSRIISDQFNKGLSQITKTSYTQSNLTDKLVDQTKQSLINNGPSVLYNVYNAYNSEN